MKSIFFFGKKIMPPYYLQGLLYTIESVILKMHDEFPKLHGAEIEWTYEQLLKYYKSVASKKEVEEPESTIERKQALVDEILNSIDVREEAGLKASFINNPEVFHGTAPIPSLANLYILAFKTLLKSAKLWRKKDGRKGYINFIQQFMS